MKRLLIFLFVIFILSFSLIGYSQFTIDSENFINDKDHVSI